MEVEDEDAMLERLFFKRYGRALPETEKEKENDVDNIKFVIDLTDEDEMEVATSEVVPVAVVKTEPIEIANVSNVANVSVADATKRRSFRLERIELAKARKAINDFGKSLRKSEVIPEKEAPLAAGSSNVIADNDTDMAEDVSVNSVNTVETVEQTIAASEAAIAESKAVIAETDAAFAANQKEFEAEFGDTNLDEFDVDIEPLC
jgi:hypothetical protein